MNLSTKNAVRCLARLLLLGVAFGCRAHAQAFATTAVQGTVYLANGALASGTLQVSWPAFTTAANQAVAAGRLNVTLGSGGSFTVNLAPNAGATPAGLYYTAVYHLSDGSVSTEYWVVPAAPQATLGQIRAQVMPAAQAVQAVSKSYVDQSIQQLSQNLPALSGTASLTSASTQNFAGPIAAPTLTASVNKTLLVAAPPYNAFCDAALESSSIAVSASGITSGFAFAASDAGKQINFGPVFLGTLAGGAPVQFTSAIRSVAAGNATLAAAPPAAFTTSAWNYGHNDTASIQSAFNDAASYRQPVQFPAGACMTGTIAYRGQSFFGAGAALTTLIGLPGQDVFQGPDSAFTYPLGIGIHDLTVAVDSSINAASSAAGGNNTFPNRLTGTFGSATGVTNNYTPVSPAVNVGPVAWDPHGFGTCGGSISAGSTALTLSCGHFNTVPLAGGVVGLPITVKGAGAAGADLITTIAAYVSPSQVTLAAAASTTVTNAAGSWGNSMNPPWYIGNCGFAIPQTDQTVSIGNFNGATFKNLVFTSIDAPYSRANFTCGMFFQDQPYDIHLENVDFDNFWGGYIEAFPAQNFTQDWAWTPDTSTYKDINAKFAFLPMVWYNGSHRILDGLSIYSAGNAYSLGLMQFVTPNGYPSATITHYYHECWSGNTGELARFSSNGANAVNIAAGNLQQCNGLQYIEWNANNSTVDAEAVNLVINGNANTFRHLEAGSQQVSVTDNGFDNIAETNNIYLSAKRTYANRPKEPANKLTASFLHTGNSATPYTSGDDLLITCGEFNFAIQNGANPAAGCTPDPGGAELPQSYFHETLSAYPGGWVLGNTTNGQGNGPYGKRLVVGDRVPQSKVSVVIQARCNAPCSRGIYIYDTIQQPQVQIGYGVMNFGTSWSTQSVPFNLSAVPLGDTISVVGNTLTGSGVASSDVAFVAFEPVNTDTVTAAVTDPRVASLIQSGSAGNAPTINAANWAWNSQNGVPDSTSPAGYSSAIQNSNSLTSVGLLTAANGGLNGGVLYPAVNSTISFTVQGPPVWTDTLSAAQTNAATSLSISTAVTTAWSSGGCLLVDQEIECWSGALTAGSTAITVARGQFNTLAQPHNSGATYFLVGTATAYVKCNSVNQTQLNLVFKPSWSSQAAPFPAQNCSGYATTFQLSSENGPTGQQFKMAAITIAQQPGMAGATASFGGSSLAAGACASANAGVANASVGMVACANPATYPGDAFKITAYIASAATVTVKVCNTTSAAATPAASVYYVRVLP